jgi:nitrate reductase assembly molybdenum cofactor insertion protein NarJ
MIESKNNRDISGPSPVIGQSILLDTLSWAFAYPYPKFYQELANGGLLEKLTQGCLLVNAVDSLEHELNDVAAGIENIRNNHSLAELETDYIALFEINRDLPPLHLNSGLYQQGKTARLETLQRLSRLYHDHGLMMEQGAEQADHLVVEMEFLAFLYRCLAQLPQADTDTSKEIILRDINTLISELEWVEALASELELRGGHPLYVPLGRLLATLLTLSQ